MTGPAADPELLATAAALLDTGQGIERLARPLTVLAFAGLLAPLWMPVPVGSLLLLLAGAVAGLGGAYAGARAGLDAALFRRLAAMAQGPAMLDDALVQLGMLPARKAGRPSVQRIAGARRLLRMQALLLAAQAGALAMAGIWASLAGAPAGRQVGQRVQHGHHRQACSRGGNLESDPGWEARQGTGCCPLPVTGAEDVS